MKIKNITKGEKQLRDAYGNIHILQPKEIKEIKKPRFDERSFIVIEETKKIEKRKRLKGGKK